MTGVDLVVRENESLARTAAKAAEKLVENVRIVPEGMDTVPIDWTSAIGLFECPSDARFPSRRIRIVTNPQQDKLRGIIVPPLMRGAHYLIAVRFWPYGSQDEAVINAVTRVIKTRNVALQQQRREAAEWHATQRRMAWM